MGNPHSSGILGCGQEERFSRAPEEADSASDERLFVSTEYHPELLAGPFVEKRGMQREASSSTTHVPKAKGRPRTCAEQKAKYFGKMRGRRRGKDRVQKKRREEKESTASVGTAPLYRKRGSSADVYVK